MRTGHLEFGIDLVEVRRLDGAAVCEALRDVPLGGALEGRTPEGRLVWHLTKQFEGRLADVTPVEARVGRTVRVYMETIGQAIVEHLVDHALLCKAMDRAGFAPLPADEAAALGLPAASGTFDQLFDLLADRHGAQAGAGGHLDRKLASALRMSDVHKRYSFMNRWFAFKKT